MSVWLASRRAGKTTRTIECHVLALQAPIPVKFKIADRLTSSKRNNKTTNSFLLKFIHVRAGLEWIGLAWRGEMNGDCNYRCFSSLFAQLPTESNLNYPTNHPLTGFTLIDCDHNS